MKKIFTTLALIGSFITAAVAQKTVDLSVAPIFPVPGTSYANLNNADTFFIGAIIKNNGTDAVTPTDTIVVSLGGCFVGTSTGNSYRMTAVENLSLAPGASDTVYYYAIQGENVGTANGENVDVKWNTNSLDTVQVSIFGFDQAGDLFTDAGVDNATGQFTTGSNNVMAYTITFGEPSSIASVLKGLNKEALNVYPNPAKNEINFDYNFKAATTATVKVMDITGREVYTQSYGKQTAGKKAFKLDLSSLQSGTYSIEFVTDESRAISKFSIAK